MHTRKEVAAGAVTPSGCEIYGNISSCAEEFKRYQNQGGDEFNETSAYLFWWCRCGWDSFLSVYKGSAWHTGIRTNYGGNYDAIFLFGNV